MKIKPPNLLFLMLALSGSVLADDTNKGIHDWTGVYVGGFVGGAAGTNIKSTEPYSGGFWNTYGNVNKYDTNVSFIGGATVGFNWQITGTPFLLGAEGEYGYLGMSRNNLDPNAPLWTADNPGSTPDNGGHSTRIGGSYGYGVVGGRLGYTIDKALLYVKSGAVFTNIKTHYDDPNYTFSTKGKSNGVGYAIGAGVEYALPFEWSNNVSIKVEYLYLGIERNIMSYENAGGSNPYITTDSISGIHTAKIGINYKF